MAELIIYRDPDEYANSLRTINLYVNGNRYDIKSGEKLSIELKEGKHSVYAKLDRGTSKTKLLNLRQHEKITMKLTSVFGSKKIVSPFKTLVLDFTLVFTTFILPFLNGRLIILNIILYIVTGFMVIDLIRKITYYTILSDRLLLLKEVTGHNTVYKHN